MAKAYTAITRSQPFHHSRSPQPLKRMALAWIHPADPVATDQFVVVCGSERVCPRWLGCPKVNTTTVKAMMAAAAAVNPITKATLRKRAPEAGDIVSRPPRLCLPAYFQGRVPMGAPLLCGCSAGSVPARLEMIGCASNFYSLASSKASVGRQPPYQTS